MSSNPNVLQLPSVAVGFPFMRHPKHGIGTTGLGQGSISSHITAH